ncbi:latrophilin Cirl isoform X2 [Rhagoletis pomonella]|uniref:latrophilin Cirl isoform X2 n=1 Tax=Rhagoletis pomonella TaxID=28610 RepID=UPI0017836964|nr:latrophilin Cirl isoform X2 [Rhagoletis pomonella]
MFPKSLTVLNSKCAHKQSCSVLATTSMFGDPCPGTHKYLEAHYQCISASQTSTTTNRPSPPWVLANNPPLLANGSTLINPSAPLQPPGPGRLPLPAGAGAPAAGGIWHTLPPTPGPPQPTLPGGRLKGSYNTTAIKNSNRHDGLPPPPPLHHHHHSGHHPTSLGDAVNAADASGSNTRSQAKGDAAMRTPSTNQTKSYTGPSNTTTSPNTRILSGVGGSGTDDGTLLTAKTAQNRGNQPQSTATQQHATGGNNNLIGTATDAGNGGTGIRTINNINNLNLGLGAVAEDETNMFCGPTNARNLFWNITRVGDVNVQPCPGGATGIAKWRCVLMKRVTFKEDVGGTPEPTTMRTMLRSNCSANANSSCETAADRLNRRIGNFEPTWHPLTPDLTQCRSLWLNSLEVRVNQRESSVISIANDLSEVTSSKTLYGGDMLVTTKIIQTMSEKMFHDKETLPDQRQREAIILELLHGVVKTGSNLLDESQLSSWMDLNQEDQMRVATSLLTGLEYNAFLLADTIIRERNIVQKVKNILLSVRVLETKNIQSNEVFPDLEQWQISDDRIELPRTALIENSEGGLVRIVFAAFDRLESILKPSYDHFDSKSSRSYVRNTALLASERNDTGAAADIQQQRIRILNSKVISASLGKGRHIQLSQPIKLVLRHIKTENVTNPTCVFWNYIDHAWSANGCNLESTNRTHSICMCNHLTNFAILMDVMDEHNHSLFGVFNGNMRILIYISISICLVFVVIALLTLKIFNGVFIKSARTSIYRSIYICLLFIEILFLIGIEQNETSILCGFTTVFLHCSILSAIAWFCFEAFQSYSTLTTDDMLLEVDQTSKVNCYYLLSYGLSLTIVAISLVINPNTYTQNDFCVLMEANTLFYSSFVAPVLLFLLGAIGYTFLSWVIMCRKSHTTLKNKEHTRLANVRFDIRCSFIFLLLLSAVWISAYYYLRLSKTEDELAVVCGYLFISFNTLMGLYIFVFHCIQNEKIRREYRKYVRQNSWLPKCLRCSKASISSGIVGNNGIGSAGGVGTGNGSGGTGGTLSGTHRGTSSTAQLKKSKLPIGSDGLVSDETGNIISAAEDAIIASSDCELNDSRTLASVGGDGDADAVKCVGPNMSSLQHGKGGHSIIDAMQGHIVLERGGGGGNTLHSVGGSGGLRTPSAGHTSPTSSAGSTHLIFGGQKQQMISAGITSAGGGPQEAYYHQPDYYGWKQPMGKASGGNNALSLAHPRDYPGNAVSPQQAHEFFYWTQKHQPHGKKKRGSGIGGDSPSGSLHSRTTAASQILFYPSYKKTTLKQQQQQHQQQYPHYDEAVGAAAYYQQQQQHQQQQQQHRRHASAAMMLAAHHQQQQQLSSDEEQLEPAAAAHAHLLHLGRRAGSQLPPPPAPAPHAYHYPHHHSPEFMGAAHTPTQRYYRNKHSNCDLSHEEYDPSGRAGSEQYYNQNSIGGGDGPVYEEILSNRNSDVQHYDMDLNMYGHHDDDDDDDDEVNCCDSESGSAMRRQQRQQQLRQRHHYEAARNGVLGGAGSSGNGGGSRYGHAESGASSDEDDDDDNEDDGEDESAQRRGLPQGDERMRRLIAMQDEEFQRRFQRQRKKADNTVSEKAAAVAAYFDHHNAASSAASGGNGGGIGATVFGISGGGSGGAGSIRALKKISPSNRIGVHELFTTTHGGGGGGGPPLPPANQQQQQYPLPKRQQLSPTTLKATTATTPSSSHTQPIIGRNISAMLDENNTVRCYLEPLPK